MEQTGRTHALEQLDAFVGDWTLDVEIPHASPASTSFEWALDGQFLVQRTAIPHPDAPDGLCVYRVDLETGAYQQHYFDSRGVVRIYEMTLEGANWTLQRDKPDFSPLPFHQRFIATFGDGGNTIRGAWEKSDDGQDWKLDFHLTYTKTA
jgi:hypothetical protein